MTKTIITALIAGSLLFAGCSATEPETAPVAETAPPAAAPPAEPAAQDAATEETPATDGAAQPAGETAPAPASK